MLDDNPHSSKLWNKLAQNQLRQEQVAKQQHLTIENRNILFSYGNLL